MSESERPIDKDVSGAADGPSGPDASGPARGPMGARGPTGPPPGLDPEERARRDARIRSLEDVYMRRGIIFVVAATLMFTFGVWGVSKFVSERGPVTPGPREVSHALRGVYNAAYADGIRMFESGGRSELARWLSEHVGPNARLPDLSAAGLVPTGVRALNLGKGWGLIQYRDRRGTRDDVLAVFAPRDAVLVPSEATAGMMGDHKTWVMEDNGLTFAWTEQGGADWVLVTKRDASGARAAVRAMLAASG